MKTYRLTRLTSLGVLAGALVLGGCEFPSMDTVQRGYRGTGMELVINPRRASETFAANVPPAPQPQMPAVGPKAGDIYQNVQILGDLSVGQFTRFMAAMTSWVAPEQGCAYCHEDGNFASDKVYTKNVARVMLAMTQRINENWQPHVADTGVTCWTCHRGNNVPEYAWSADPGPERAGGMVGQSNQNISAPAVGYTSLPYDPFSMFLSEENQIRVASSTALPTDSEVNIKDTEHTYALMMHFSGSLGVNCTYCHNSRNFRTWEGGPPTKVTAWHGIRMVREINNGFIESTAAMLPEHRLGAMGDVPKVNCMTCHQGAYKPLYGAQMLKDYPSLAKLADAVEQAYLKKK